MKNYLSSEEIKTIKEISNEYDKAYKLVSILFAEIYDKAGEPYLNHLLRVSQKLKNPATQVAGLLHDILEDIKGFTLNDLEVLGFSQTIVDIVFIVTRPDDSNLTYDEYITKILSSSNLEAIKLKYSDMTDNLEPNRLAKLTLAEQERLQKKYTPELIRIKNYLQERNCLYE